MGWTDEEIDEIAREASHHAAPEYKQAYWSEMEALLDAKKTGRKGIFWWFLGTFSLVLAIGVAYYLVPSKNDIQQTIADNQQELKEEFETSAVEGSFENKEVKSLVLDQNKPINSTNDSFLKEQKIKSTDSQNKKSTSTKINTQQRKNLANQERQIPLSVLAKENFEQQNNIEPTGFGVSNRVTKSDAINENQRNDQNDQFIAVNDLEMNRNFDFDNQEEIDLTPYATADFLPQRKYGFYVGLNAGAGTSYMKNSKDLLVQWGAKMGYEYTFFNKLRLGVGVGFRQQLLKDLVLERNRTYYSHGLVNINQSIRYDRLHFLDLNVHAHYLFRRLSVGIQFTPSYLIGARANLVQNGGNFICSHKQSQFLWF